MKIIISCSNILLDIEESNLLENMFRLPYTFLMTDVLFQDEVENDFQNYYSLKVIRLNEDTISFIESIFNQYPNQSSHNLYSLGLAKQEECNILTNEKSFHKICKDDNINCFSSAWILSELEKNKLF